MKNLGQYFTTDLSLQAKVREFIRSPTGDILEPAAGEGDLVRVINKSFPDNLVVAYEIDKRLSFSDRRSIDKWHQTDFLKANIDSFGTIVANPPYVKTKCGNLYVAFVKKCFDALKPGGQMIFIVPSDFFKLTQSSDLLTEMCSSGSFTDVYWPHDESLFANASIDILIFRYEQGIISTQTCLNGITHEVVCSHGVVTFRTPGAPGEKSIALGEICNIHVGLISGKESVFKSEKGNVEVLNGEDKRDRYILINDIESDEDGELIEHLSQHKEILMARKIRSFSEDNWFEWGALRNYNTMLQHKGTPCAYMRTLTRDDRVCFAGKVELYGGGLIMILPKKGVKLDALVTHLNSPQLRQQFIHSGRFKIGQRHLTTLQVPVSLIG
jgi:adenine-specific DNA-methyltransferase